VTTVVDGKKLAAEIRAEIAARVEALPRGTPCLATVQVGEVPESTIYVRHKHRAAKRAGMNSIDLKLPEQTTQDELLEHVAKLNADASVHGMLVQLPLPAAIDPGRVAEAVAPEKDVDGLHPFNVGKLVANQPGLRPGTPRGCIEILERNGVQIEGARAVVIGRSEIVGKPVALMLLHRHATVTLCHSRTRDLPGVTREADIVVAAVGQPRMIRGDWIKAGAAVIDVGTNSVDGKLVGDVDFEAAAERAGLITPVPGGVGPLTIAMVLQNTLEAFALQTGR
jgi:methylenetetrahydrofolate dehydrogenase (NADP+)/methenyltetrahydrofolate cyclohydrolase